jgi:hypothetical protein
VVLGVVGTDVDIDVGAGVDTGTGVGAGAGKAPPDAKTRATLSSWPDSSGTSDDTVSLLDERSTARQ